MIWLEAKPFTRAADPDKIIAAVKRGHPALDSIHSSDLAGVKESVRPREFSKVGWAWRHWPKF